MKNPVNSRAYSGAGLITPENPLNSPGVSNGQGYNTFDLSNQQFICPRFAEITPFSVIPVEPGDRINLKSSHELRAPTFKSPLMSELRLNKDYFFVPKSAMMPNTWDYLAVNPNRGDDVPEDAFPVLSLQSFLLLLCDMYFRLSGGEDDAGDVLVERRKSQLFGWWLCLAFKFLSYGSLPDRLGYRQHLYIHYKKNVLKESNVDSFSFGLAFDQFVDFLLDNDNGFPNKRISLSRININDNVPSGPISVASDSEFYLELNDATRDDVREFFYRAFSFSEPWVINFAYASSGGSGYAPIPLMSLANSFGDIMNFTSKFCHPTSEYLKDYNLYRFIAYQMACVQFFSNDTVDDVFTAKLWLQNMESIQRYACFLERRDDTGFFTSPTYFDRNGIEIRYDVFSKKNVDAVISVLNSYETQITDSISGTFWYAFVFFSNLFEYHNALRYGDYFAGARPKPLAVGDVNISINSQMVSAVDVTKGITMQRFLNAINRVGQLLPDYMRNIFGVAPKYLPPQPRFVNHESEVVSGQTVVNTAENQGNQMLNMISHSSKFAYDVFIDEQGYLLGLASFTCLPAYMQDTPRDIYHYDRLDDFQPFLQNIGDQEIYIQEIVGVSNYFGDLMDDTEIPTVPFGFQLQDAEYKYGISSLHDAFIRNLPSWAFVQKDGVFQISPDFLRLTPVQFDRFVSSLTGCAPDSYYHFIMSFNNKVTANRRMMYRPGIL